MEPTKLDADALLRDAAEIEAAVRARTPREYPLYVAMGLTTLLLGLAVDLGAKGGLASVVAAGSALAALAVTVGTNLPYLRRYRQVRARSTPFWLEWALGLWSAVALFSIGILLDGAIGFSYTLGGLVGAVPFLLWAQRLRHAA